MIYELTIEDEKVIKYLDKIDDEDLDINVEKLLKLSIDILEVSKVSLNLNESIIEPINMLMNNKVDVMYEKMNTIFNTHNPLIQQINNLNDTINDFKGKSKISKEKGRIGENCISRNIQKFFPKCELKDMTNQPHQSDYHFYEDNCPPMLIEVKTYKNNVPTEQVLKFKKDLELSDFKAGIMVSTTSGISKKNEFEWEIINDKILVYLPNSGIDGYCIMWAIIFIRELNRYLSCDHKILKAYKITNKLNSLKQLIVDITNTKGVISKTKYSLLNSINNSFDNLDSQIDNIEEQIKRFIDFFDMN